MIGGTEWWPGRGRGWGGVGVWVGVKCRGGAGGSSASRAHPGGRRAALRRGCGAAGNAHLVLEVLVSTVALLLCAVYAPSSGGVELSLLGNNETDLSLLKRSKLVNMSVSRSKLS